MQSMFVRAHFERVTSLRCPRQLCRPATKRGYATHSNPGHSSLLSQSLDTKRGAAPGGDSVGPFQLGLAQRSLRHGEKVQKWSELSTSGKVIRTTARTTNLTVILFGAGLSALLVYSLTSELFSKNSPTVLYGEACDRIKASHRVAKYLAGPLSFHNTPPSAVRPRHRNRHVISQIMVDAGGQEHMIMTFYVQGRPLGSDAPPSSESSYIEAAAGWVQDGLSVLSGLTLDESVAWTKERAAGVWERSKGVFRYLTGTPLPPPPLPVLYSYKPQEPQKEAERGAWSFAGMFSSLKGSRKAPAETAAWKPDGRIFTDGEVHAHLVRNEDGYFAFRYLLIDIPNSRDPDHVRVFVERAPGVRENEPVMRWNP